MAERVERKSTEKQVEAGSKERRVLKSRSKMAEKVERSKCWIASRVRSSRRAQASIQQAETEEDGAKVCTKDIESTRNELTRKQQVASFSTLKSSQYSAVLSTLYSPRCTAPTGYLIDLLPPQALDRRIVSNRHSVPLATNLPQAPGMSTSRREEEVCMGKEERQWIVQEIQGKRKLLRLWCLQVEYSSLSWLTSSTSMQKCSSWLLRVRVFESSWLVVAGSTESEN